ncbi:hypothetical protein LEP1GSC049_3081 [Leptospira kirschneri serovar Cynopteri str. 3522 CT]|nr:hypothetical protein LEP1GSC049_3081 [Leptospira kirschneri serovar Cynopteri str. 3522 CT]
MIAFIAHILFKDPAYNRKVQDGFRFFRIEKRRKFNYESF